MEDPNGSLSTVPRPGRNAEFDAYVAATFGDVEPEVADMRELRRAAWRTWRTSGPTGGGAAHLSAARQSEDEELARVLALSAEEHRQSQQSSRQASRRGSVTVLDDDEELQRAIASSMETPSATARTGTPDAERRQMEKAIAASLAQDEPIVIESDSEDEMAAAIRASLGSFKDDERERKRQKTDKETDTEEVASRDKFERSGFTPTIVDESAAPTPAPEPEPATPTEPAPAQGLRLGGLMVDRAQLERERLARQAARAGACGPSTAGASSTAGPSSSNAAASSSTAQASSANAQASSSRVTSSHTPSQSVRLSNHPVQSTGPFPRDAAGEYYPDGELRHVSLKIGSDSGARTFSPQDVFGGHAHMALMVMSSFVWDNPWLYEGGILPTPDVVPTVRISRPAVQSYGEMAQMKGKLQPMETGEVRSYPPLEGQGSEHMKFAWIFYKTGRLRVAIMTANMVNYDWESIENTVFLQDFLPTKPKSTTTGSASALPDFPDQFRTLFNHLKIPKALKWLLAHHPYGKDIPLEADPNFAALNRYDWSRVQVRLVMSVGGKYIGVPEMEKSGLGRLSKVLRDEGWLAPKGEKLSVEYQGSSLGAYNAKWLNDFYSACEGRDLPTIQRRQGSSVMPPVKIIFPSLATVDNSINGRPGGGTMFSGSAFKTETAPLFHDANSRRGGVLMHTKMIIALFEQKPNSLVASSSSTASPSSKRKADEEEAGADGVGGWVYVGSHNFSSAAWGTLNFTKRPPTLHIRNYELGLVLPLPRANANAIATNVAAHKRPPRPYGKNDVPWSQDQHM